MSVHDRWAGARSGSGKRWEVRYREAGVQRKQRFVSRTAAESFEAKRRVEPEIRLAAEGRMLTVDQMMATWLATKGGFRPKTVDAARTDAREVLMQFSGRLASSLGPTEIRVWSGRIRGVALRRRSLMALGQAYKLAIVEGLLTVNPCLGAPLPKLTTAEPHFLSWFELRSLAEAAGASAPLVWLLGTSGLRIGEAVGLQVGDVRPPRVRVSRAVSMTSDGLQVGPPKSGKGRDVPVPAFVLEMLPTEGRAAGEWLFTGPRGGRLNPENWRTRVFRPAARAAGLDDLHPHDLRHTAASLAIQSGADVLMVQRMLGHASPSITLNIYAHAFDTGLDDVAQRMNRQGE